MPSSEKQAGDKSHAPEETRAGPHVEEPIDLGVKRHTNRRLLLICSRLRLSSSGVLLSPGLRRRPLCSAGSGQARTPLQRDYEALRLLLTLRGILR